MLSHLIEAPLETRVTEVGERDARADMRGQIGRIEAEMARLFGSAFPRKGIPWGVAAVGGPRILDLGDLERVRDALAGRLGEARTELDRRGLVEEDKRRLLERMLEDPATYRGVRISAAEIGEPGCGAWESKPRWGVLGMLLNWWRVKLSSGCPLAAGLAAPAG